MLDLPPLESSGVGSWWSTTGSGVIRGDGVSIGVGDAVNKSRLGGTVSWIKASFLQEPVKNCGSESSISLIYTPSKSEHKRAMKIFKQQKYPPSEHRQHIAISVSTISWRDSDPWIDQDIQEEVGLAYMAGESQSSSCPTNWQKPKFGRQILPKFQHRWR